MKTFAWLCSNCQAEKYDGHAINRAVARIAQVVRFKQLASYSYSDHGTAITLFEEHTVEKLNAEVQERKGCRERKIWIFSERSFEGMLVAVRR